VHNFEGQSKTFTTSYAYPQNQVNASGPGTVPSSQTFPDNERVEYTYDAGGALQSIKTTPAGGSQQTIISSVLRNSRGQTIAATYGNGAISIHRYNEQSDLRLNQIQTVVGGTLTFTGGVPQISGGTTLQNYGYSFDNNANVIGVTDGLNSNLSATYTYDKLDQLNSIISAFVPPTTTTKSYVYDKLGNLTNKEGVGQTYYTGGVGRGPHALATSGGVSYNYDANGNLIATSNGTLITWNAEDMPIRVVQNGVTMYQKFFLGESLWKKVEPGITTYYLPSMRIENGQVRKFFDGFAERSPDGSLKFYHGDYLGSASLVTDTTGNFIRRQAYMPYGEDRFVTGSFTDARYQFNFKEKELSTGFYDYGARLYNPGTGRWLSADPSANDGTNRYMYVRNNPLKYVDPTGNLSADPSDENTHQARQTRRTNRKHINREMNRITGTPRGQHWADWKSPSGTVAPSAGQSTLGEVPVGKGMDGNRGDPLHRVTAETALAGAAGLIDTVNAQAPFWLSLVRKDKIKYYEQNAIPYDQYGNARFIKFYPCENAGCVEIGAPTGRIPGNERVYTGYGYYMVSEEFVEFWGVKLPPVPDAKMWGRGASNQYWDRIKRDFPIFNQ